MPGPDIEFMPLPAGKMQGSYWFLGESPGRRVEIKRNGDTLEIQEHYTTGIGGPLFAPVNEIDMVRFRLDLSEARRLHHGLGIMLGGPGEPVQLYPPVAPGPTG